MRALGLVVALAVLAATVGGCDSRADRDPSARSGGRACLLVEYDRVEAAIGVRFDTAAGAEVDHTYSCLLGRSGQPFPELLLTLSQTAADPTIYRAIATPAGFTAVEDLGRSAYQLPVAEGRSKGRDGTPSGPGLQIGWLSQAAAMLVLTYTWPAGTTDEDVAALTPALLDLARAVEQHLTTADILG